MTKTISLTLMLLFTSTSVSGADWQTIEENQRTRQLQQIAGQNDPLTRPMFQELCQGVSRRSWCEGYLSALVTAYQIPRNCMPMTDMALFQYEQLWGLTLSWVMRQPQDSRFSIFEAISGALADEDRCPMGPMGYLHSREYVPYSEVELQEFINESSITPLEPVEAEFPAQAQQEGISGWAQVSFNVTTTGTVENVQLVDSEPPLIFDEVSLKAATRLRFKPLVRNGAAIEVPNVHYVFRFPPVESQ